MSTLTVCTKKSDRQQLSGCKDIKTVNFQSGSKKGKSND